MKKLFSALLATTLTASVMLTAPLAVAKTDRLIIEDGNNAASNEAARQSKEQWNDTRNLRNKVNTRVEKEFDKADRAFDTRDACEKSYNVNAYWEPNTLRCLDRRTGRPLAP
ncbi:DUF1283 family protein [Pantoea dispersa]|uniref:UPF0482 protein FK492_03870 n=1 Tax=Pantoea dispersa TaxID=59814 RepID=A0A8E1RZ65_9GAMM|nr:MULTISPECIES: DUF1283 family protein [Pantoea]MBK4771165.1 DUF1283 family protein [Pantoea sp. Morm]KAA8670392.1 DUF1283 family protein [Pantoea dispersa]KTR89550.1 hypothetical protein SA2_14890 [Pantoea dispersa]KTR99075.1 hypothetical protein NS375_12170 [Pantoea dispersa]KTS18839.1 hypothetical protein NS215_04770 [Pantoea dispersa]